MRIVTKLLLLALGPIMSDEELDERMRQSEMRDLEKKIAANRRYIQDASARLEELRVEPTLQRLRESGL